ncbi:uncharacterized protein LOC122798662 [Protopterus annectens]|uniref:uncharacterized protein LOC122798662 n=1 Tax=Protopterus annectens TaxID=7888 RepID=UPI001CFA1AC8|nr:uncharacterized protein LOC122798662 [Protopterus annectens]
MLFNTITWIGFVVLSVFIRQATTETPPTISNIDELKTITESPKPPAYVFALLWWTCAETLDVDNHGDIVLKFNLELQPFGFHYWSNWNKACKCNPLPESENTKNYALGNLNTNDYPSSRSLPSYVRFYHDYLSSFVSWDPESADWIVISTSTDPNGANMVNLYFVTSQNPFHIEHISPQLIQSIRSLSFYTFLATVGYETSLSICTVQTGNFRQTTALTRPHDCEAVVESRMLVQVKTSCMGSAVMRWENLPWWGNNTWIGLYSDSSQKDMDYLEFVPVTSPIGEYYTDHPMQAGMHVRYFTGNKINALLRGQELSDSCDAPPISTRNPDDVYIQLVVGQDTREKSSTKRKEGKEKKTKLNQEVSVVKEGKACAKIYIPKGRRIAELYDAFVGYYASPEDDLRQLYEFQSLAKFERAPEADLTNYDVYKDCAFVGQIAPHRQIRYFRARSLEDHLNEDDPPAWNC